MRRHAIVWFMLGCTGTFAQSTWLRTYGGAGTDQGRGVRATVDGGYIVCGSTGSFGSGSSDIYVIKLDGTGTPEWSSVHGGGGVDQAWMVEPLDDGYLVVGTTASFGAGGYDGYLLRLDAAGGVLWQQTYGTADWDFLHGMARTEGRLYLIGSTYSESNGGSDVWTLCVSDEGLVIWEARGGGAGEDEGRAIRVSADGGCVVVGTVTAEDGSRDALMLKYAADGALEWSRASATAGDAVGQGITTTSDGGYVLGGWTNGFTGLKEMMLWKLDADGEEVWLKNIGQIADWEGREVREKADGGLVMCGWTEAFGGGGKDMYLLNTDADGDFVFGRTFGAGQDEEGWSLDLVGDGGYVVAGSTNSYGPGPNAVFVVRTDSAGFTQSNMVNEYSDPLDVASIGGSEEHFLFPVPVQNGGVLHVQKPFMERTDIMVHDAQGRLVEHTMLPGGASSFPLPTLPSGLYVATLSTSGKVVRGRIIVQ